MNKNKKNSEAPASDIINEMIDIRDTSPEFDSVLQIGRFRGNAVDPQGRIQKKGELFIGKRELPFLGKTEQTGRLTSTVEIKDNMIETTAHELIHVLVNAGLPVDLERFNEDWKKEKDILSKERYRVNFMSETDKLLESDPRYNEMTEHEKANERFAFM